MSLRHSLTSQGWGTPDRWFAEDGALVWFVVVLLFAVLMFWWGWGWGGWW